MALTEMLDSKSSNSLHCHCCSSSEGGGRSQNRRAESIYLVGLVQDRQVCVAGMVLE